MGRSFLCLMVLFSVMDVRLALADVPARNSAAPIEPLVNIAVDRVYNRYRIVSIEIEEGAPAGTYTFSSGTGNDGKVVLRRNGEVVQILAYPWQTTVGGASNFTFSFPGVCKITVTYDRGTANLFDMPEGIFDGQHMLAIP